MGRGSILLCDCQWSIAGDGVHGAHVRVNLHPCPPMPACGATQPGQPFIGGQASREAHGTTYTHFSLPVAPPATEAEIEPIRVRQACRQWYLGPLMIR
jgi:hypothetical protein